MGWKWGVLKVGVEMGVQNGGVERGVGVGAKPLWLPPPPPLSTPSFGTVEMEMTRNRSAKGGVAMV